MLCKRHPYAAHGKRGLGFNFVKNYPFMAEKRVIRVSEFYPTESEYENYLKPLFEDFPPSSILIIVNSGAVSACSRLFLTPYSFIFRRLIVFFVLFGGITLAFSEDLDSGFLLLVIAMISLIVFALWGRTPPPPSARLSSR